MMLEAALLMLMTPPAGGGTCVQPSIALVTGTVRFFDKFRLNSRPYKRTQANFRQAFDAACRKGLLDAPNSVTRGANAIHVENAPDANAAALYADETSGEWRLVFEYPFVAGDGSVNVPTAEEIEEAIYCAVVGATPAEQEASGRCLVD